MTSRILTIAAATASATFLAIGTAVTYAPDANAALTTTCRGAAQDVRVKGNLVVPADASCELTNVTIDGDIVVKDGGSLIADKGRYRGDLRLGDGAYLDMLDGRVDGSVSNNGGATWIMSSDLRGDYLATAGKSADRGSSNTLDGVTLGAKITNNANSSVAIRNNSTIAGSATSRGDWSFSVENSQLLGDLIVEKSTSYPTICQSEIYGDARFSKNRYGSAIGSINYCDGMNYFGKNLTVESNGNRALVSNNIVVGDLSGEGNATVYGQDNRVRGEVSGQFVDMQPETPEQPNGQSARSLKSSNDESAQENAERRAKASNNAKAAGRAF